MRPRVVLVIVMLAALFWGVVRPGGFFGEDETRPAVMEYDEAPARVDVAHRT